jgi:Holliday junction resolvasome RuvABC ATP-dependent DNA helicase subunit
MTWLHDWEKVHIYGIKKDITPNFSAFRPAGSLNSKAALLSGDAGLGKTTAARLIAAH